MMPFTAGCQRAISWKLSSTTQSNSIPGRTFWASLSAGSAWIRSPSDVSLMSRILGIRPREQAFQEGAEPVTLQVVLAGLFGGDVVELDGAPLAVEGLVSVPAVRRDLEDQAAARVGRYLGRVTGQVVVVVQQTQAPFGRAPAGIQVEQDGDELRFRIGVDAAVFRSRSAAHGEHRRPVLQVHAEPLADQVPQLETVHLVHERGEAARIRDRFGRKAATLSDMRKALDDLRQHLGADEVVDDE